jgi:hypothetical protein
LLQLCLLLLHVSQCRLQLAACCVRLFQLLLQHLLLLLQGAPGLLLLHSFLQQLLLLRDSSIQLLHPEE